MIDYSVYMQPNPFDETVAPKAYAKAQMRELMTFTKFVNHIASHNGVFSRGTVRGVLSDACTCLVEQLLEGKKIQLGELGDFWISLTSNGAETLGTFSAANIKAVNIIFTPGADFENLRGKAEFNLVASRVAQAATLKTEKAGGTTVDLEAARAATRPAGNSNNGSGAGSGEDSSNSNGSSGSSSETPQTPENPETPASGAKFTIQASVSGEGGSIVIKKNGETVEGGSVEASAGDTVVIEAVPDSDNFQFMGWSDGVNANPRTIQPTGDVNVTANFLDLSRV